MWRSCGSVFVSGMIVLIGIFHFWCLGICSTPRLMSLHQKVLLVYKIGSNTDPLTQSLPTRKKWNISTTIQNYMRIEIEVEYVGEAINQRIYEIITAW